MELGYELTIEQTQKLSMTPELIQAIKILQLNTMDLREYVQNELMENPILEVEHRSSDPESESEHVQIDIRDRIVEDEYADRGDRQWELSPDKKQMSYEQYTSEVETLHDHLLEQLRLMRIEPGVARIARSIIDAIDDNGYLSLTMEEICTLCGCTAEEAEDALECVQQMDPEGVGARSLSECLELQLAAKGLLTEELEYILENLLSEVANNKISLIARKVGMKTEQAQEAVDLIRRLEPKPGRQFAAGGESTRYIIPDIVCEKVDGEYTVRVNDSNVPRLMVSSYYKKLTAEAKEDRELDKYLNDRFNSATWLIRSIEQRKQTIFQVAAAIVHDQEAFFEKGNKYLRTLTMRQIADELGIHESTVSRAINGKYIQSPRGVFELKYFFSSGVSVAGSEDGMSSNSVKAIIKEIIDGEDARKPKSDQEIVSILQEKGIGISRRTVAKYREGMGIQSSSKRRRY